MIIGDWGDEERLGEWEGSEGLRDCVWVCMCTCARVWMQGSGSDKVRYNNDGNL